MRRPWGQDEPLFTLLRAAGALPCRSARGRSYGADADQSAVSVLIERLRPIGAGGTTIPPAPLPVRGPPIRPSAGVTGCSPIGNRDLCSDSYGEARNTPVRRRAPGTTSRGAALGHRVAEPAGRKPVRRASRVRLLRARASAVSMPALEPLAMLSSARMVRLCGVCPI
jgi:hypothetical protein